MKKADGYTSSSVLYKWLVEDLKHPIENIIIFTHSKKKQHGLDSVVFKDMLNSDADIFFLPDSSTNDLKQQKQLIEKGKSVIILDHHSKSTDEFIKGVCLVNNQLGDDSNKELSGVGVVVKFIECLGYPIDKYKDILAVGLIADSMPMNNSQNRIYVNEGLKNIQNGLIKELLKASEIENPSITDISFNVSNMINSVIRFGKKDEEQLLWDALIGKEGEIEYSPRKTAKNPNPQTVMQTLQEAFTRISANVKQRQNNAKKKALIELRKYIEDNGLTKDKCIIIKNEGLVEHSIGGLCCMSLVNEYSRPVIILSPYKGKWSGSLRSPIDLKEIINDSGIAEGMGHSRSCGVFVDEDKIQELRNYLNDKLKDVDTSDNIINVDYVFNMNELNKSIIQDIADLRYLWSVDIKEPVFAVKNIKIDSIKIKHNKVKKGYATSFKIGDIRFIKNFSSQATFDKMTMKDVKHFGKSMQINLTVVCKFKQDKYGYYVSIEDFNVFKDNNKIIF